MAGACGVQLTWVVCQFRARRQVQRLEVLGPGVRADQPRGLRQDPLYRDLHFESKCLACHTVGQGRKLGPDVAGVTKRRTDEWLRRRLKSPEATLQSDNDAKAMLKEFGVPMPNQELGDAEVKQYIKYFHWIDEQAMQHQAAGKP